MGSPPSSGWWHRYALLLAAAAHDVGHPARMNPFVVAAKRPAALAYAGGAAGKAAGGVLEAMHAATFVALTRQHNVLEHLGGGAAEGRLRETVRARAVVCVAASLGRRALGRLLRTEDTQL